MTTNADLSNFLHLNLDDLYFYNDVITGKYRSQMTFSHSNKPVTGTLFHVVIYVFMALSNL